RSGASHLVRSPDSHTEAHCAMGSDRLGCGVSPPPGSLFPAHRDSPAHAQTRSDRSSGGDMAGEDDTLPSRPVTSPNRRIGALYGNSRGSGAAADAGSNPDRSDRTAADSVAAADSADPKVACVAVDRSGPADAPD